MFRDSRRKRRAKTSALIFFLAGVIAVGLLASLAGQNYLQTRTSVEELKPNPDDLVAALPIGSAVNPDQIVPLLSPVPAYAVAYSLEGKDFVAALSWDRPNGVYVVSSTVALPSHEGQTCPMVTLAAEQLGDGAPFAMRARGSCQSSTSCLIAYENGQLRRMEMAETDGSVSPACLPPDKFYMQDVNSDGVADIVEWDGKHPGEDRSVYLWVDGKFVYSDQLSWAVTADRRVFPQPLNGTLKQ